MSLLQRHYHLYMLFLSVMLAVSGGLVVVSLSLHLKWPWVVISVGLTAWLCLCVWRAATFVPSQVNYFMSSLLNSDSTSHFPLTADRDMRQMYAQMNHIMTAYGNVQVELETKRMYYDRILRIMTHELRNSVTPLITLSEDMLNTDYSREDTREAISVINEQCSCIKHFLDSYYELTHLPKPQKTHVDIRSLFARLARLFGTGVSSSLSVSFACAQGLVVLCDENQIAQVLTNLVKNAIEALPLDDNTNPQGRVNVVATATNGTCRITVTDNGPGIPASKIEEVFLPFYTSKATGSGIGLAISRQIMQLHGGSLTCYSYEGEGATFVMEL